MILKVKTNYPSKLDKQINFHTQLFTKKLKFILNKYISSYPEKIRKIIYYSLFPGGKRIRPILMFASGKMLGVSIEQLFYPACSIELIHNYSLIHDDLPSMDNDDYRRGKLTVHKKFGEANAILTGDGLLTLAFEILCDWDVPPNIFKQVVKLISLNVGFNGLVKGQFMDLEGVKMLKLSRKTSVKKYLEELTLNKTAKLIEVSILIPAIMKKVNNNLLKIISNIGAKIGLLFQITDDLIDYYSGQDVGVLTYPAVYGEENTGKIVKRLSEEIVYNINQNFDRTKAEYLVYLVNKIATRKF